MSEKYLPLTSGRGGVRVWVGITQFKVSLDINLGALIQHLEVVVLGGVEGDNVVPGGAAFRAICGTPAAAKEFRSMYAQSLLPSGLGGGGG
jgi:hypothetical protein